MIKVALGVELDRDVFKQYVAVAYESQETINFFASSELELLARELILDAVDAGKKPNYGVFGGISSDHLVLVKDLYAKLSPASREEVEALDSFLISPKFIDETVQLERREQLIRDKAAVRKLIQGLS